MDILVKYDHTPEQEAKVKESARKQAKAQDTGDNTMHLYECYTYAASLVFSIVNRIKLEANDNKA